MFSRIKAVLKKLPFPLSKNHRYDLLTKKIIRKYCNPNSNCVDVGAHRGEVLQWFKDHCPQGFHYAFEPIPFLFQYLEANYGKESNIHLYDIALSNAEATVPFNYVISNPAYSGLKKRVYDRKGEKDTTIQVKTALIDDIIPKDRVIDFIKIDVEGAEMKVLQGARRILTYNHPIVVFEFGIGGSDVYDVGPEDLFSFFEELNYRVFLLEDFLKKSSSLDLAQLKEQFYKKLNYYFVAY